MYSGTTFTETDKKKLCPNYQPQNENPTAKEQIETCPINPNDVSIEVLHGRRVFLPNDATFYQPWEDIYLIGKTDI